VSTAAVSSSGHHLLAQLNSRRRCREIVDSVEERMGKEKRERHKTGKQGLTAVQDTRNALNIKFVLRADGKSVFSVVLADIAIFAVVLFGWVEVIICGVGEEEMGCERGECRSPRLCKMLMRSTGMTKDWTHDIAFDHLERHGEHLVNFLPDILCIFLPSHSGEPGWKVLDCGDVNQHCH
jgi:hypothetical protein